MGRIPLYATPQDLQTAIDAYFDSCKGKPLFDRDGLPIADRNGIQRTDGHPPTITGLALSLGFSSRHGLTRQKKRGQEFCDAVLTARTRIERFYEEALFSRRSYRGAAFMLSMCFGWRKQNDDTGLPAVRIINRREKPRT